MFQTDHTIASTLGLNTRCTRQRLLTNLHLYNFSVWQAVHSCGRLKSATQQCVPQTDHTVSFKLGLKTPCTVQRLLTNLNLYKMPYAA